MNYTLESHQQAVHFWEYEVREEISKLQTLWALLCTMDPSLEEILGGDKGADVQEGMAKIIDEAVGKLCAFGEILLADGRPNEKDALS